MFTSQDEKNLSGKKKKEEQQRVYKLSNRNEIFSLLNGKEIPFSLRQEDGKIF
jgi:hypothetical protein